MKIKNEPGAQKRLEEQVLRMRLNLEAKLTQYKISVQPSNVTHCKGFSSSISELRFDFVAI